MILVNQQETVNTTHTEPFVPIRIIEIELGQEPVSAISAIDQQTGKTYQRALCLVRLHTQPLGLIELQLNQAELPAQQYLPLLWNELGACINAHLQQDGLPPVTGLQESGVPVSEMPRCLQARQQFLAHAPFVSVIVPTHERPDRLALCIQSLLASQYPSYELIVVDNAPSTNVTADLVRELSKSASHLHYIREDRQGPSWARNCGMKVARGEILVFADDDVIVDKHWLVEMVRPFFFSEQVACVSGLVMPLKLDTPAQLWFEQYGGFSKGFTRRIYDLTENRVDTPLYPYNAGSLGVGASMAFRARVLRRIGGFDPALGGRGPAKSGEDLAAFFKIIIQGHQMVYEPTALLYHLHRQEYAGLRKQIRNYGIGQTAYLTKNIVDNPLLVCNFLAKVPYGLFFLLSNRSTKNTKKLADYPHELTQAERQGMLYGPLAYIQSRWMMHNVRKEFMGRQIEQSSKRTGQVTEK